MHARFFATKSLQESQEDELPLQNGPSAAAQDKLDRRRIAALSDESNFPDHPVQRGPGPLQRRSSNRLTYASNFIGPGNAAFAPTAYPSPKTTGMKWGAASAATCTVPCSNEWPRHWGSPRARRKRRVSRSPSRTYSYGYGYGYRYSDYEESDKYHDDHEEGA